MQSKGMEALAEFSAREVKRAAERKEKETSIPLQDSESQSRRQSQKR